MKSAKPGRHADGDGLYLLVKPTGAMSWLLRVQVDGKRRDFGLGSAAVVKLAEARDKADQLRRQAKSGVDPVAERKKVRLVTPTFKEAASVVSCILPGGDAGMGKWMSRGKLATLWRWVSSPRESYGRWRYARASRTDPACAACS